MHVRFRIEPVDALPGNFLSFVRVGRKLLDLGLIHRNRLVTSHAETDARNSGIRALRHSLMTAGAVDIVLYVDFVIERDWLDGRRLPRNIFFECVDQ